MDLTNLKPAAGATKKDKRIARGQGSGHGGTSTRGNKGAQSRSGYSRKIGFEGGQMPLQRRVPKFGFKNINRIEYRALNIDMLQELAQNNNLQEITPEILHAHGLIAKNDKVKILGRGKLTVKLEVKANAFSATAVKAIEELGGNATKI